MLAKMLKFKAQPLNKKILAAPALPAPQRSTPHPPEFQASQHAETSSLVSTEMSKVGAFVCFLLSYSKTRRNIPDISCSSREVMQSPEVLQATTRARKTSRKSMRPLDSYFSYLLHPQHNGWMPHLTEPKSPLLQTMLRARPSNAKTSNGIEQEELEKVPRFRARPLNQKCLNIISPCQLSLNSDSCREKPLQRNTTPNPLLLRTEIKEKEMMYKRYREETEAAKMVEEERALKQLRRTMVPHARPVPNFNNPFLP
ncbi:TPX2 C-terminal [Arabidopsis thaliana x Arabidopsis arenosa]|uniref:TPX2 C-terminal n=1 Tax=Arabidopsis thaliana x Arabidopsis arenosa TaxID=1240361 RepID=A0A8T1XLY6_9BRAS|nr:TPX2 C-terminal [Arabidopsis thaliana x Arabidopsis arenosa]